jgi:galactose-1-phosphate uridylyltransferase
VLQPYAPMADPLATMADGTVKQVNPFSGTEVWTVPGRGHRPLGVPHPDPRPLDATHHGRYCAFCECRYLETPPEKARLVREGGGYGGADSEHWRILRRIDAEDIGATVAEFRRIPNLFEIVSYDYWHQNYGYTMPPEADEHRRRYLASPAGREHVLRVAHQRWSAAGHTDAEWAARSQDEKLAECAGFFGGGHDVIVARRHYVSGATTDDQLASSGTLSPAEHAAYTSFTITALRDLYDANRYARYVAVFQNWLKPAGASFDHLHKQLVAIDERGVQTELELQRLRVNHNLYNEMAVDYAGYHNLVVAENEHAVAFAGFGHRYPTLEIYSTSPRCRPWEHTAAEQRGMSDLIHACHAATSPEIPCNEEWHYQPPDQDLPMPWRVGLKWRVSTLAGFEGGTKIYLNTIDPWNLRDRVVPALQRLRGEGRIADSIRIATECACRPNSLRYNPALQTSPADPS